MPALPVQENMMKILSKNVEGNAAPDTLDMTSGNPYSLLFRLCAGCDPVRRNPGAHCVSVLFSVSLLPLGCRSLPGHRKGFCADDRHAVHLVRPANRLYYPHYAACRRDQIRILGLSVNLEHQFGNLPALLSVLRLGARV